MSILPNPGKYILKRLDSEKAFPFILFLKCADLWGEREGNTNPFTLNRQLSWIWNRGGGLEAQSRATWCINATVRGKQHHMPKEIFLEVQHHQKFSGVQISCTQAFSTYWTCQGLEH